MLIDWFYAEITMRDSLGDSSGRLVPAVAALLIAIGGILLPIPGYVELYRMPIGSACRPMGQAVAFFFCGFGSPLIVIILGVLAWSRRRTSRFCCVAAVLLSLVPLPLYRFLLRWIIDSHHLTMEP